MPSAFGHAVAALALAKASPRVRFSAKTALIGAISAAVPDIDVLAFTFGIAYDHPFGHRGFTHSLVFAAIWAFAMLAFYRRTERTGWLWSCFFICVASHPLLDMCTNGGLGCALLAPFSNKRLFFPWRPIAVSPVEVHSFFGEWGLRVLKSEALWIGLPSMAVYMVARVLKRRPARH
ncbi:MAG: metal-dependent hydrolase [Flavobacteriales bacterium]